MDDTLAVSFAAPGITRAGPRDGRARPGPFERAVGHGARLLLALFADAIGRRRIVIVNLILMGGGMLLSAFATSIVWLAAWRA
jgi:MFS family permease